MYTILVVDDEVTIREMLRFNLARNGFNVLDSSNTAQAKQIIKKQHPNLVLLDIMLPGQSGTDLIRELRNIPETQDIPIIMLTAKDTEQDKINCLNLGADDYISKPFSPAELIARINSLLRRVKIDKNKNQCDQHQFLDLHLNSDTCEIFFKHEKIELSPIEFKLLSFFISHPGRVFSRSKLLDYVWGLDTFIEERTVDVYIRRLRQTLKSIGYDVIIQTVRGMGYRLNDKAKELISREP